MANSAIAAQTLPGSVERFERVDTYFLFPFALDRAAIRTDHPQAWPRKTKWIDGLDAWIAGESGRQASQGIEKLGPWRRASYTSFDIQSAGYTELVFFNSIVRHVFFDTNIGRTADDQENQLRCYTMAIPESSRLWFEASDVVGRSARVEVNDLRLFLSVQGIGILSIGVAAGEVDAAQASWINRRLRKLYPTDANSVNEGRTPNRMAFSLEEPGGATTLCEERFESVAMVGFYPPLPNTVRSLLYFADYSQEEYEPVLDENMLVYTYAEWSGAEDGAAVDELLFLRHRHFKALRYEVGGSTLLLGITGHSCSVIRVTAAEEPSTRWHEQGDEDVPIVSVDDTDTLRAFHHRYYHMVVIALFYRAVLLDFNERSALVSRRLLQDQQHRRLSVEGINMVNDLRTEFLNFSSYWHFNDVSAKQGDNDAFRRLCAEYKIEEMKGTLSSELRHMGEFVYNYYQLRNTDAVNRLAILSLIFGGGAVLTGFFGMNFNREFGALIFEGEGATTGVHYVLVALVTIFVVISLSLGTAVIFRNWREYLSILNPPSPKDSGSIKRDS